MKFSVDLTGMTFTEVRYRCLLCQDTGLVPVLKASTIAKARKDPDNAIWKPYWGVLCRCKSVEKLAVFWDWKLRDPRRPLPVYQEWMIWAHDPDAKAKAAASEPKLRGYSEFHEFV